MVAYLGRSWFVCVKYSIGKLPSKVSFLGIHFCRSAGCGKSSVGFTFGLVARDLID